MQKRLPSLFRTGFCLALFAWTAAAQPPAKDLASDSKGLPARAAPTDYQAQAKAGEITIAAEFVGHSIPTPQRTFSADEYVCVEVAFFGSPAARLKLSMDDFSIRINGKKNPSPREPYDLVFKNLKDPEWEPPIKAEGKSKTQIGSSGGGGGGSDKPPPPKMPNAERRAMEQAVQKSSLLEGDRALPQAGLIFFPHRGKVTSIQSIELIYSGPAGKASLALQP